MRAQSDKATTLQFRGRRFFARAGQSKTLRVAVEGGNRILAQNALLPPVAKVGGSPRIYIVCRIVTFFLPAKDDADKVVWAGRVVTILQGRSDLVVRLGDDLSRRNLLRIIAIRAKRMYVSHGNL